MGSPERPKIVYSAALEKMKGYLEELKSTEVMLKAAKARKEELKKYLRDITAQEAALETEEKKDFSNTKDVLNDELEDRKAQIIYLEDREQELLGLIEHEGREDQFMQDEMDYGEPGNA